MPKPISVGLLGATGTVGQRYLLLLDKHPWFHLNFVASSRSSEGKTLGEALEGRWRYSRTLSAKLLNLPVHSIEAIDTAASSCRIVFSAIGSTIAREWDEQYAAAGLAVVAHASCWRGEPDIPLIIPEVNAQHLDILDIQRKRRGWKRGCLIAKPNCSLQSYLLPLWPLHEAFGLSEIIVTTFQAASGAGYPGIPAQQLVDNVIPYIAGEEEKSEIEPLKILGDVTEDGIHPVKGVTISANCTRVGVTDGHLACLSVRFHKKPDFDQIIQLWTQDYHTRATGLPSAPPALFHYSEEVDRPQPALDREAGAGMTVTLGRLRPCPVLDYRFTALSHNAIRGAAGGGLLLAELLAAEEHLFSN